MNKQEQAEKIYNWFDFQDKFYPTMDDDYTVRFNYDGCNYFIMIDDKNDINISYFLIALPNILKYDQISENLLMIGTEVMSSFRGAKLKFSDGNIHIVFEAWCKDTDHFLEILGDAIISICRVNKYLNEQVSC